MQSDKPGRYGVIEQTASETDVDYVCETIRHLGYAVIDAGYESGWLEAYPMRLNAPGSATVRNTEE